MKGEEEPLALAAPAFGVDEDNANCHSNTKEQRLLIHSKSKGDAVSCRT